MNLRAAAIAPFVAAMLINGLNNGFGLPQNTGQGNQHNSVHALVRAPLVASSAPQPWLVMPLMAQQPWLLLNSTAELRASLQLQQLQVQQQTHNLQQLQATMQRGWGTNGSA